MSFIISVIYQQKDVYIAADTKASSKSGLLKHNDVHKIKPITDSLSVGITGDFIFGIQVLEQNMKSLQKTQNTKEVEQILSENIIVNNRLWREEYGINADCTFMPVCLMKEQPYISLTTLSEEKLLNFQKPFQAGKYQFFFANPTDFEFHKCLALCSKILLNNQDKDPDSLLNMIVNSVADHSQYVNHTVDVWQALSPKY